MGDDEDFLALRTLLGSRVSPTVSLETDVARSVIGSIPTPIFIKDTSSRFVACNQAFANYVGADIDSIIGLTDEDMPWGPATAASFVNWDQRVMSTGRAATLIEEPIVTASGATRWLETNKVPLRSADGTVIGLIGSFWDITDRRKLQEAMMDMAVSFATTPDVDSLMHEVCITTREILSVDLAAVLLFGPDGHYELRQLDRARGFVTGPAAEATLDFSWLSSLLAPGTLNGATSSCGPGSHIGPAMSASAGAMVVDGRTVGVLLVESRSDNLLAPEVSSRLGAISSLAASSYSALQRTTDAQRAAVVSERARLEQELHDTAIQALSSASLLTSAARRKVEFQDPLLGILEKIQAAVDTSQGAMRSLVSEPNAEQIEATPVSSLVESAISKFSIRSSIPVVARLEAVDLNPEETLAVHRIVEEALNNIYRHAKAKNVTVTVRQNPTPTIVIADDGVGMGRESGENLGHYGLSIMKSRATKAGGTLSIQSKVGVGTTVSAELRTSAAESASEDIEEAKTSIARPIKAIATIGPLRPLFKSGRSDPTFGADTAPLPSSRVHASGFAPFWWLAATICSLVLCYGLSVGLGRANTALNDSQDQARQSQVIRERVLIVRALLDELTLALAVPFDAALSPALVEAEIAGTELLQSVQPRLEQLADGDDQSANEARLLLSLLASASDDLAEPRDAQVLYGLSADIQFDGIAAPQQPTTVLESVSEVLWLDQAATFVVFESLITRYDTDAKDSGELTRAASVCEWALDAQSVVELDGGWLGPDQDHPLVDGVIDTDLASAHEQKTLDDLNSILAESQLWDQDQWIRQWPSDEAAPIESADDLLSVERSVVSQMREVSDARLADFVAETQSLRAHHRRVGLVIRVAIIGTIMAALLLATKTVQVALSRFRDLRVLSKTDPLTGVGNRKVLETLAVEMQQLGPRSHSAVVSTDMDRFKLVNDSYGHSFGDRLLQLVATGLAELQPKHVDRTTVIRLGGDEFMLAIQSDTPIDLAELDEALNRLRTSLLSSSDGTLVEASFSYGTATAVGPCELSDLLHSSDLAAYQDKARRLRQVAVKPAASTSTIS